MKLNEHQAILTPKILLVPYCEHHVPTYHEWMQDEDLQQATASEPLSLPEEYAMQQSWRNDADKLTFIVCEPSPSIAAAVKQRQQDHRLKPGEADSRSTMIGDVNLFLTPSDDDDHEDQASQDPKARSVVGEIEIMIASKQHQGKGLGKAILLTLLWYVVASLSPIMSEYDAVHGGDDKVKSTLKYLRVKIGAENNRSIRLFESVGFVKVSETPNYFGEMELRREVKGRGVEEGEADAVLVQYG
ncbi:hypothetical protein EJ04DRAFT_579883 [Polyplosphaeria fusca]|uniref:N-acetyltransferase domain-containing protein n=1 Tax=Polyplosphaeria fusca TaxID=682080 RepID=A0A9P4QN14_9PLEO|nr:hypothetical protein EJ04DRAFT_579883 [Polyplosphaeria fusca]